jgi:RNA polymerase sigma-70 factor, ECF subfamily
VEINPVLKNSIENPVQSSNADIELIKKLHSGDKEAIEVVFNNNFERLYLFVFYEVGQNQNLAEDVVQDTFISAIKSATKFKGNSGIFTWLVGIAHHKIADQYRRTKREQKYDNMRPDGTYHDPFDLAIDKTPGANIAESAENRILVEQALNSLPSDYREVIIFKYVEDFTVEEISKILNRSPKSIEGVLSRARKSLKEFINQQSEG